MRVGNGNDFKEGKYMYYILHMSESEARAENMKKLIILCVIFILTGLITQQPCSALYLSHGRISDAVVAVH